MNAASRFQQQRELEPRFVVRQTKTLEFPVWCFDLNREVDAATIARVCEHYHSEQWHYPAQKTDNVLAWHTRHLDPLREAEPELLPLFAAVETRLSKINAYRFIIEHFWVVKYNRGESARLHDHGYTVDLAAIYYAAAEHNPAALLLQNGDSTVKITPKTGMLVVMPGLCGHAVEKAEEHSERTVVAFNIVKSSTRPLYSP